MAWTTPRTWKPLDMNGASLMNQQVRDNMNFLKTNVDDDGSIRTALKCFAYSAGQGTAAGGDTEMDDFNVTIPAGYMSVAGDMLEVHGVWLTSATAGTKLVKISLDAVPTMATLLSTTAVSTYFIMDLRIRYRSALVGTINGIWQGSTANITDLTVAFMQNVGLTATWAVAQTLKFYGNTDAADELTLLEFYVNSSRTIIGQLI